MVIYISSVRKAAGCTTLALSLGITIAANSSYSVLLVDANHIYSDMDAILGIETDTGLDDVLDLINSNRLDRELFRSMTTDLGNLHLLTGSKIVHYNRFMDDWESFNKFVGIAETLYDIVIIDYPSSLAAGFTCETRGLSMILLKQNFLMLEAYVRSRLYNHENSIVVINQYDEVNKLDRNRIVKQCRIEVPVFTLKTSARLSNAFNEKKLDEYVLNCQDSYLDDLRTLVFHMAGCSGILLKKSYIDEPDRRKSGRKLPAEHGKILPAVPERFPAELAKIERKLPSEAEKQKWFENLVQG